MSAWHLTPCNGLRWTKYRSPARKSSRRTANSRPLSRPLLDCIDRLIPGLDAHEPFVPVGACIPEVFMPASRVDTSDRGRRLLGWSRYATADAGRLNVPRETD